MYFTTLKALWDNLQSIDILPSCTYGVSKKIDEINNRNKLMQFLMRLNDSLDLARNQMLLMDPLPSNNKAYSMILKFESQSQVLSNISDNSKSMALLPKCNHKTLNRKNITQRKAIV